jgi:hypothetical protein
VVQLPPIVVSHTQYITTKWKKSLVTYELVSISPCTNLTASFRHLFSSLISTKSEYRNPKQIQIPKFLTNSLISILSVENRWNLPLCRRSCESRNPSNQSGLDTNPEIRFISRFPWLVPSSLMGEGRGGVAHKHQKALISNFCFRPKITNHRFSSHF